MKKIISISCIGLIVIILLIIIFLCMFPRKYSEYIDKYSSEFGVDKYIIASVINIESSYDSLSVSDAGAVGLMQLLPSTAKDMATRLGMSDDYDLFDVETNIKLGTYYLSYLIKMFDGNITNSLASYNWGLANVKKWISDGNIDENGTIINIPIKETSDYLKKYSLNKFVYKNVYKV